MREGSPTGGPSFFQASRGSAANDLGRVDDALGDQIAVPAGLRVEAVVVLVLLEELSDDDGTVFTGALTARGSATRCPRYGRIGTMVQQRDTSGCITTPALDADLMAAPLIEKQKPLSSASWSAVRRNGTARSRKLTVLPMRILWLRPEAHLHLTS